MEQNGRLFFHGYEMDPDMEYLYAAECHTENKFCCIMRPRDKLRRAKYRSSRNKKYPVIGQERDLKALLNGAKLKMKL